MFAAIKLLLCDDTGQGLVEYALILAFVTIVAFAGLKFFGTKVNNSLANSGAQAFP